MQHPLNPQFNGHIPIIKSLRGVAALAVCLFHLVLVPLDYIQNEWIRDFFSLGCYGVHMFFMISAIVIPLSLVRNQYAYLNWGNFMLKRFLRLEPLYLVSIVCIIIKCKMRVGLMGATDNTPETIDLLFHLGYLIPFVDGQWVSEYYWTLSVEFQYYLALSLFFPLVLSKNKYGRFLFYAIFLISPFLQPAKAFLPLYGPIFLAGIMHVLKRCGIVEVVEYGIVSVVCIIVSMLTPLPVQAIIASMSTLIIVHYLPFLRFRLLEWLGDISYSLYLTHTFTGLSLVNILSRHYKLWYQQLIVIAAGTLLSIGIAWIFYLVIEKPSLQLAQRIRFRKQEPMQVVLPESVR